MGLQTRLRPGTGYTYRGANQSEMPLFNLVERATVIVPPSYSASTVKDANLNVPVGTTTVDRVFGVNAQPILGKDLTFTVDNQTPSVATLEVDAYGRVILGNAATRVSDGTATVDLVHSYGRQRLSFSVVREVSTPPNQFVSWVTGSLAKYCHDNIDTRIAGKTANDSTLKFWSTYNNTTKTYVWNTNMWAADYDWTGVSPWTTRGGSNVDSNTVHGVAVTRRHVMGVAHLAAFVGNQIIFVKPDGTNVTRTITARINMTIGAAGYDADMNLCLLDSDLPTDIKVYKILPSDYLTKLPNMEISVGNEPIFRLRMCRSNQTKTLQVADLRAFYEWQPGAWTGYEQPPVDAKALEFYRRQIVGDSGSPNFLLLDEPVLLWCNTWANAGVITYGNYLTEINNAIIAMGGDGGYRVTAKDLSAYPTY